MRASVNRQWVLKERPQGEASVNIFEKKEVPIPELNDRQILVKGLVLSFDPSQRAYLSMDTYVPMVKLGEVMRAFGAGQVVESKHPKFRPGQLVFGGMGWQDYVVLNPDLGQMEVMAIPNFFDPALMLALTITGLTGYFGVLDLGRPRAGETVVVSGAAGATGSIAAQVAKIKGCRVIGIAGGAQKCKWLTDELGLDAAIDYKNDDVTKRLDELCPNGINIYFDNVGGELTDQVLLRLAEKGRVILCGSISQYNTISEGGKTLGGYPYKNISALTIKSARIEGFLVTQYLPRAMGAIMTMMTWIDEGKLIQAIDMQEGFDNIPKTLTRLFSGANTGKQLLKLSDPPIALASSGLQKSLFGMFLKVRSLFVG